MRLIRNVSFALLAIVAGATSTATAVSAKDCLDLTGIPECVSCSAGPNWYGTCYTGSGSCSQFECNGPWGPEAVCSGGSTYLCQCPQCA